MSSTGKVVVRDRAGQTLPIETPLFSSAELKSLTSHLARALGCTLDARHPSAHGVLDGELEVQLAIPPLVQQGPVIALSRRQERWTSLTFIRDEGALEPRMAMVLERAAAVCTSMIVLGARRRDRRRVLGALADARSADRRIAVLGPVTAPPEEIEARELLILGAGASLDILPELGVDCILAEDPSPETWAALLTGPVPFLATLAAPDLESGLERLVGVLSLARPGLARSGADALLTAAIDLAVELVAQGDRAVISALSELERTPEGLLPSRLVQLRTDGGGIDLALRGSKLERRLEKAVAFEAPQAPSLAAPPPAAETPAPRKAALRSGSSVFGRGGLSASGDDLELPSGGVPVGRLTREQLAELTPDQLVSQSFIVDVSDVSPRQAVRLLDQRDTPPRGVPPARDTTARSIGELRDAVGRSSTEVAATEGDDPADSTLDLIARKNGRSEPSASRHTRPKETPLSIPPAETPIAVAALLPSDDPDLPSYTTGDGDWTQTAAREEMLAPAENGGAPLDHRSGSMTAAGLLAQHEDDGPDALILSDAFEDELSMEGTIPKRPSRLDAVPTGPVPVASSASASSGPPAGSVRRRFRS